MLTLLNQAGIYRFRISRPDSPPKFYIGHASILRKRRDKHLGELRRRVHKNQALQRAFDKYGEGAFAFEVLIVCPRSAILLELYEQKVVDSYQRETLYNICRECVGSRLGVSLSPEHKARIGAANKGRKPSAACLEAVRLAQRGRIQSQETRAKRSASLRGNKNPVGYIQTLEHRLKSTRHFIGKGKPPEEIARRLTTRRANAEARGYY